MLKVYVGTSGWMYDWNPDGFEWFIRNSGLNAVELNSSFYRFPYSTQVKSWAKKSKGRGLRWAIKVHRLITHSYLLSRKSIEIFNRFLSIFKPLSSYIDFYLLQLPPRARPTAKIIENIENFVNEVNLGWRLAIEWRNLEWFNDKWVSWAKKLSITVVSVDSPDFIFYARSGPYVYVRFHGRTFWYAHYYTDEELDEVANKLLKLGGDALYAFFNNDHDMLDNARKFLSILHKKVTV